MSLICESDDLKELLNLGEAYAAGKRWVAYNSNKTFPIYTKTVKAAEKARIREHACWDNQDKIYCDGSGGGVYSIKDEVMFILRGTTEPLSLQERDAYRGLIQVFFSAIR